jgi:DHA1 family inner membrane transport protein
MHRPLPPERPPRPAVPLLFVLGVAGFASSVALRAADPTIPTIAADLDVELNTAAWVASAYSLPYAAMQLVLGPVGDAIGKARLIKLSLVVLFVALILTSIAPDFATLIAARVLAGAFAGGIIPVSLALIGDRVAYEGRQVAISRFLVAVILGQMAGSAAAGGLAEMLGWRWVFAACAASGGIALAVALPFLRPRGVAREPLSIERALGRYRSVVAHPHAAVVLTTVALEGVFVFGVFPYTAPMLARHGSGSSFEAGVVLGAFAAGGILYSLVVGRLIRRLGLTGMMQAGGAILGLVYAATALPTAWGVVAATFLVAGFAFYMLHNTMQTLATELAPEARGSALALFACTFFAGQGIGPPLAGALSEAVGLPVVFIGFGALTAVLGFTAARLLRLG